jgi:hypothetical protein
MVVEVNNILDILRKTLDALEEENSLLLKNLSDRTVHSASIAQDSGNIAIAVIVYSLSKIVERKKYQKLDGWKLFYEEVFYLLERAIESLERKDEESFKIYIKKIRGSIEKISGQLRVYIEDVFRKAKINKASRIYEHGISMEQTAKILGITLWELANYSGSKGEDQPDIKTLKTKDRIKLAMEMFE